MLIWMVKGVDTEGALLGKLRTVIVIVARIELPLQLTLETFPLTTLQERVPSMES